MNIIWTFSISPNFYKNTKSFFIILIFDNYRKFTLNASRRSFLRKSFGITTNNRSIRSLSIITLFVHVDVAVVCECRLLFVVILKNSLWILWWICYFLSFMTLFIILSNYLRIFWWIQWCGFFWLFVVILKNYLWILWWIGLVQLILFANY